MEKTTCVLTSNTIYALYNFIFVKVGEFTECSENIEIEIT